MNAVGGERLGPGVAPQQVFRTYEQASDGWSDDAYCVRCGEALQHQEIDGGRPCGRCGHRSFRNAAPAVSVLVTDEARVLLCRRVPGSFRGGQWCLPCGFVDYHEDFLSAARREVREETGLDVTVRGIVSVVSNFHRLDLHTLVVVLHATVAGGTATPGDDIDALTWHEYGSPLPTMAFDADAHIIERFLTAPFPGAPVQSPDRPPED